MNVTLCENHRQQYNYPPARLDITRITSPQRPLFSAWGVDYFSNAASLVGCPAALAGGALSSVALDAYHGKLLNSPHPDDRAHGVVSAVYWGYYADARGGPNGYAPTRAEWIAKGNARRAPNTLANVAQCVANAGTALGRGDLVGAWASVLPIHGLGPSFITKVLMFMEPTKCVVLDRVVIKKLQTSRHTRLRGVRQVPGDYRQWCKICENGAVSLNLCGSRWVDWDGSPQCWRSVDVERAVFAYPGDPDDLF